MRFGITLIAAASVAAYFALAIVLLRGCGVVDGLSWLSLAVGWAMIVLPLVVRRNDRVHLWLLSLRYRFVGSPSLPWSLSIRLHGDFSDTRLFDSIIQRVENALQGRMRVLLPRAVNGLRMSIEGLGLLDLSLDDVDEFAASTLTVELTGLRVAPHEATTVLEREIAPLVRAIESAASHVRHDQAWTLRVKIAPGTNPYLGLYLRDRRPEEVEYFHAIVAADPAYPADRFEINKGDLYLSATTPDGFARLVRNFVTLSGRGVAAPAAHV